LNQTVQQSKVFSAVPENPQGNEYGLFSCF